MSERVRTDVPSEFMDWMRNKAPVSADQSDAEVVRYWLQYAKRQYDLEEMRATGSRPNEDD